MLRARWRLMMALAAWALVSVLGQSVEDALVAIGDLQLIEREVGRLDAHLHAADLRAAAQRSCFEHCDNAGQAEGVRGGCGASQPAVAAVAGKGGGRETATLDEWMTEPQYE